MTTKSVSASPVIRWELTASAGGSSLEGTFGRIPSGGTLAFVAGFRREPRLEEDHLRTTSIWSIPGGTAAPRDGRSHREEKTRWGYPPSFRS